MKNKPISKSFHMRIDLKYDMDSFNLKGEGSEDIIFDLKSRDWSVVQCSKGGWQAIKVEQLYEGKETVVRHPDGEEYVYKVYKKTNEGHRDNYPEIKEDEDNFQVIIPMLRAAISANNIEECKIFIPKLKYNWINCQDDEGNTFLHLAAISNANIEICKLLISKMHSVPINVQNDNNKLTAYQEAKNRGYIHICELLEDITLPGGKKCDYIKGIKESLEKDPKLREKIDQMLKDDRLANKQLEGTK